MSKIELGLVRCGNCNKKLTRVDNPYQGFCSERCKRIRKGIESLNPKDLNHIVFWYQTQRQWEYDNEIKNKKSYRGLKKLLDQLHQIIYSDNTETQDRQS